MAYARKHGNQISIVHGEREADTGKVQQRVLFNLYSKEEALAALGKGPKDEQHHFRSFLELSYPGLRFDWKRIDKGIASHLDVLPETYPYAEERLRGRFRADLRAFARQLFAADPQTVYSAAELIRSYRHELEVLNELIEWRVKLCDQKKNKWNQDNRFFWRFEMQRAGVPVDAEELAAGYFERREFERAEATFGLLVECFEDYADGYNYLGWIAEERGDTLAAIEHFRRAVELGRRLFPKRISKKRYWSDHHTRPYIRGLASLAGALGRAGQYDEALAVCHRLEGECADKIAACCERSTIHLNTGNWKESAAAALYINGLHSQYSLVAGFALYEAGSMADAIAWFLHGAFNCPRAALMLLDEDTGEPHGSLAIHDHNNGVGLWKDLQAYLERSDETLEFFRGLLRSRAVHTIIEEIGELRRHFGSRDETEHHQAFQRLHEIEAPEFARGLAQAVIDSILKTGPRSSPRYPHNNGNGVHDTEGSHS